MLTVSLSARAHRDRCISDEQCDVKSMEYSDKAQNVHDVKR